MPRMVKEVAARLFDAPPPSGGDRDVPSMHAELIHYLPESLQEMIPEIGLHGVHLLVQRCGGMDFKHLPPDPGPNHALVGLVGMELARKICRIHARCDLSVPRAKKVLDALRNAEIVRRYDGGTSVHDLVREFGLTERWIRTIINQPTVDPRQMTLDLFLNNFPC